MCLQREVASQSARHTLKEKGRRTALKPKSLMRHTTVLKSCVRLLLPAHSPATIVAEVSNPNQFRPCSIQRIHISQGCHALLQWYKLDVLKDDFI